MYMAMIYVCILLYYLHQLLMHDSIAHQFSLLSEGLHNLR